MNFIQLRQGDIGYPGVLNKYPGNNVPESITALGNIEILSQKMLALFCSVKCPGKMILQTYDLMQNMRQTNMTVISGFHSPMEKECLTILLRGHQSVIICPARSIKGMRIGKDIKKALETGRLLLLSPFIREKQRITAETSWERNRFVAALADKIFVTYAEPNSKTEQFSREVLAWGKPLYTFSGSFNKNLIELGAKPVTHENISEWLR